jgi:anti-sigma B factor antagonist
METPRLAFDIAHHADGDNARIAVTGEVDMTTGDRLERQILAAEERQPATLTIDLTGVEFIDSTGLQLILDADVRAKEAGRRLVVAAGTSEAARVLALAGVADRLTVATIE